jgi:transcriptional regulator with XRE-family HTH domain
MKTRKQSGKRVAEIRKIIGKSQSQFAALVGVSKHTIISVENDRNQLTDKLIRRIQLATGARISNNIVRFEPVFNSPAAEISNQLTSEANKFIRHRFDGTGKNDNLYTREDFDQWRANFYPSNDETARRVFDQIKIWVEYIFRAAAKSGVAGNRGRLPAVHQSLVDWLNDTLENFKLFDEVDTILEEETHAIGETAYSISALKDPKNREDFKKRFAEQGYDFDELKKHFKKASPGDMMVLETESRRVWYPFNGSESVPCRNWKLLQEPKFRFEFAYDYMSRVMNAPVKELVGNNPEILVAIEKLRSKSKERTQTATKVSRKS